VATGTLIASNVSFSLTPRQAVGGITVPGLPGSWDLCLVPSRHKSSAFSLIFLEGHPLNTSKSEFASSEKKSRVLRQHSKCERSTGQPIVGRSVNHIRSIFGARSCGTAALM